MRIALNSCFHSYIHANIEFYAELSIYASTVIYIRKLNSQLSTSNMLYSQKSRNRTGFPNRISEHQSNHPFVLLEWNGLSTWNESMKTKKRKLWQQNPTWGLYISFLQSRHSSMEGIARPKFRQNLSGDSDWIDFMIFGICLLQELLHRLLCSYWCVILLLHTEFTTHSRRISYYRHLTWHTTVELAMSYSPI